MNRTLHIISFYELSSCAPWGGTISRSIHLEDTNIFDFTKGGCKSEDTGQFLHLQHKYSKSLSCITLINEWRVKKLKEPINMEGGIFQNR